MPKEFLGSGEQMGSGGNERTVGLKPSRVGRLMGIHILGVGSSVPPCPIRNEDLAVLGYDADWIVQRTGIFERRHAPPEISTSDLAVEAAERCLARAGIPREEVDFVLVGTYTPDYLLPSTACLVQDRLGLTAPAVDLQAACASFVYALVMGMHLVAGGSHRRVLVIGADCNSRVVDPKDVQTFPLFGDAAGAVLLGPGSKDQGLVAYAVGADGSGADLLHRKVGGARFPFTLDTQQNGSFYLKMEGRPVFKWAIRLQAQTISEVIQAANVRLEEIDLFIFHQANMRIIQSAVESLGINPDKVFNNVDRYGNTSSASIPLALDEAHRQGRIQRGDLLLLSGFGAVLLGGLSFSRGSRGGIAAAGGARRNQSKVLLCFF
jgi:3-oxoacyl-[acyl-carrier-protein] synthase III (EC 2.3.1.41)